MLKFDTVQLPLGGPDQKSHRLLRSPGTLDRAVNVRFEKIGQSVVATKRYGYQRVDPDEVVGLTDPDAVYLAVATLRNELVVTTYDGVLGLGDRSGNMRGSDTLVYRGPNNRGAARIYHVGTSQLSQNFAEEDADT